MKPDIEYDWAAHDARIRKHYTAAQVKHPYFCDFIPELNGNNWARISAKDKLAYSRMMMERGINSHSLSSFEVLRCEIDEAVYALTRKDTAAAVEELYDCVAVCLRTIDVLEGRQKLGKPEKEGARK